MDIQSAHKEGETLRGAAAICRTTHKPVKRILEAADRAEAGLSPGSRSTGLDGLSEFEDEPKPVVERP